MASKAQSCLVKCISASTYAPYFQLPGKREAITVLEREAGAKELALLAWMAGRRQRGQTGLGHKRQIMRRGCRSCGACGCGRPTRCSGRSGAEEAGRRLSRHK